MHQEIRILQIGVGSMGKRRIRNLKHIGVTNITCYDCRKDRLDEVCEKYGVNRIDSFDEIFFETYTHLIISTPPDLHMFYAKLGIKYALHTFIEASVVKDDMDEVIELYNKSEKSFVLAPSCTMRFDPIIEKAKEIIESGLLGQPLSVNHYFGQYLPCWHPYEDIKDFYVSKRETGAAREIVPFDLVYLTWLIGDIKDVCGVVVNGNNLGVDIDEIYSFTALTTKGTILQMTVEVLSKISLRETKLIMENGGIIINNIRGELSVYDAVSNSWTYTSRNEKSTTFSSEEMYVKEMQSFINSTTTDTPFPYSIEEDKSILESLLLIERHSKKISIH